MRLARTVVLVPLLGGLVLLGAPAHAAPVFVDADTHSALFLTANLSAGSCTKSEQVSAPTSVDTPIVENGPALSLAADSSVKATGAAGDVITAASHATVTSKVTSVGGNPRSIDIAATATGTFVSQLPTSACQVYADLDSESEVSFTVAQAGFLDLQLERSGGIADVEFELRGTGVGEEDSSSFDGRQSSRIFLVPGAYDLTYDATIEKMHVTTSLAVSGAAAMHATFAVAGSTSLAPTGKARSYVALPATRSCATHAVTATVTGKKHKAAKIKKVDLYLGDTKVKTLKHVKKGAVVTLPVADGADVDLRAVVELAPKQKGHPGKELDVSSSYVACTA